MEMVEQAGAAQKRARLLINRNYGLLWGGRAVSITGDFVFTAGLVVWIGLILGRGQSWAPLAVSGVMVAATLPVIAVGPVAGVLADRWDKRRTMLWTDALRLGLMIALVLLLSRGDLPLAGVLGSVYGAVFLVSVLDQFFRLSMVSVIPSIVQEQDQARALGLGQASASLAMIAGPPIAAPLVLSFGIRWALVINALSFLVSYLMVRAINVTPQAVTTAEAEPSGFGKELLAGIQFLIHTRALVTLMLASMIAMIGGAALNTLDVFFVTHNLHTPGSWYGLLDAVFGIGAVLGAVLTGTLTERLGAARTVWGALLLLGVLVLVYARLTAFAPAAVLLFICGAPMAARDELYPGRGYCGPSRLSRRAAAHDDRCGHRGGWSARSALHHHLTAESLSDWSGAGENGADAAGRAAAAKAPVASGRALVEHQHPHPVAGRAGAA